MFVCDRKKIRKFFVKGREKKTKSEGKDYQISFSFALSSSSSSSSSYYYYYYYYYYSVHLTGRHGDTTSGSDEDLSPEHDQQSVKVNANVGYFHFQQLEYQNPPSIKFTLSPSSHHLNCHYPLLHYQYKAASHNKGKLDFERVRLKQELCHNQVSQPLLCSTFL